MLLSFRLHGFCASDWLSEIIVGRLEAGTALFDFRVLFYFTVAQQEVDQEVMKKMKYIFTWRNCDGCFKEDTTVSSFTYGETAFVAF